MTETAPPSDSWASSLEEWTNTVHHVTLVSGRRVTYRDVTVGELAFLDALPTELLEIAVAEYARPGAAAELAVQPLAELPAKPTKKQQANAELRSRQIIERIAAVNRELCAHALIAPKLTAEQLRQVPVADLELLTALVARRVAVDAEGKHVGVVPIDWFRTVTRAHGHDCPPQGCEACETARRALSTVPGS